METKKKDPFEYFDPNYLEELSHSNNQSVHQIIDSYLFQLPDMLDEVEYAVNQRSTTKLKEAVSRVLAAGSVFTRHDFSKRFSTLLNAEDGPISGYTLKQLSDTLHELNQLKQEVIVYQQSELSSQLGIIQ